MGKKSSKKQPNVANHVHTAESTATPTTGNTTVPTVSPSASQPASVSSPATTQHQFFDFITLATVEDIKNFLKLASTTPEGKNLENLWRRAHEEGYEKGRKVAIKGSETEARDKYREGIARGMDLGREQGYNVAKEAFDDVIQRVKAGEAPKINTSNAETQTDSPATTTTSIFTQTDTLDILTTSISTQTESSIPLYLENNSSNIKNAKIYENSLYYSEIYPKITVFSSPTPSATSPNSTTLSTTTKAPETRQITADFAQKHGKVEKTHIPTKMSPEIHALSVNGPGNDTTRVYTSQLTPNDDVLHSLALSTTANSLPISHPTNHEKSELHPDFESQPPTEHTAPTLVNTSLKTRSASGDSRKITKKSKNTQFPSKTARNLSFLRVSAGQTTSLNSL